MDPESRDYQVYRNFRLMTTVCYEDGGKKGIYLLARHQYCTTMFSLCASLHLRIKPKNPKSTHHKDCVIHQADQRKTTKGFNFCDKLKP